MFYSHHSKVTLETLRSIFNGHMINCTAPPMTEACVKFSMDNGLRRCKNEAHATIRSLLEAVDERNNDNEFVCCSALPVIVPTMMKERQTCMTRSKMKLVEELGTELVKSLNSRVSNEAQLNYKFNF